MANIQQAFERHRRALLADDAQTLAEMTRLYAQAWEAVNKELTILNIQMQTARANGEEVSWSKWTRAGRLRRIEQVLAAQTAGYAQAAGGLTGEAQQAAIDRGVLASEELIQIAVNTWNKADEAVGDGKQAYRIPSKFSEPNMEALNAMVGYTADGSPLADVLLKHAGAAQEAARAVMVQSMAEGWAPIKTARQMRDAMGAEQLYPAMRIARTETLRSYNTASMASYKANDDILEGWQWEANVGDPGSAPCAACFALHGKVHMFDDKMQEPPAHPQCRCCMLPVCGWPGEDGATVKAKAEARGLEQANKAFDGYTTEEKSRVLGSMKAAEAVESGKVDLRDFLDVRISDDWGKTYGVHSLKRAEMMANMRGSNPDAKTLTADRGARFMEMVNGKASPDEIRSAIKNNEINLRLSKQQMERHMSGHKSYDEYVERNAKSGIPQPSAFDEQFTLDDIQALIVRMASTGELMTSLKQSWTAKEFISNTGATLGYTWDSAQKIMVPTQAMVIEYGKNTIHCYPALEITE